MQPNGVYVDLTAGYIFDDGFGHEVATTGFENVEGSELGDTIIGSGTENWLNGWGGNDVIYGFGGDDETPYLQTLIENNEFYVFELQRELTTFNGLLGPVMFGCQAECTEFEMSYDLIYMMEKSKLTIGNSDDDFFSLLHFVEGDLGYAGQFDFKVWDIQYWDYGGSHRLGDDTCLEVVKKLIDFKKKHKLFSDLIEVIHSNLF